MNPIYQLKYKFFYIFSLYCFFIIFITISKSFSISESEIIIDADVIEVNKNKITANGNILIKNKDFTSSSDKLIYDDEKEEIRSTGNIIIKDSLNNHYYFDKLISNKNFSNALGTNTKIRMVDGSRIVGSTFSRTGSNINRIDNASYTPCFKENYIIKNCPGWKLNAKKVIHDVERKNIYYQGATLSILNIPILYSPFFSHPDPTVKKRSGLLMPTISSDNRLGTSLSIPYFYNISSNYDLTFTPTIQSKADDYYSINYRHLSSNHNINIDVSITNDESKTGTKNHIFINGNINNPFGKFDYKIENSNNDTYLRKNYINQQTVLASGLIFTKEKVNSYLEFETYAYKHLNNTLGQKWEYIYPSVIYNVYNYNDPIYGLNWKIDNSLLNYKDINKNFNQQISTQVESKNIYISRKTGLRLENIIQNRLVYFNNSQNNYNQIRIFPQISSKISFPLTKNYKNKNEILEPIIMPILAPYNNYSDNQTITTGNIFSLNRATSISQWESGPRINYGINWLISNDNLTLSSSIGQSAKINKDSNFNNSNEISNYFIGSTLDFGEIGYLKTDITIDRKNFYLKDNNINSSIEIGKVKLGFDYDYETLNKIKTSEQISIGAKIDFIKSTKLIMSIRKDLMSDKSIGNSMGLHYENDCLAINFDYYRDFTSIDDIKNSRGFSFNIVLKPFGTSKQLGKVRNFGPSL